MTGRGQPLPTTSPENLARVIKAYDIRGLVPQEIDEALARAVGAAFVGTQGHAVVVVGHDMRASSPALAAAFADGVREAGADCTMIGLASTDQLYFASGSLGVAGAMVTASHNPAAYNGIKLCGPYAAPVGMDSGLDAVRDAVAVGSVGRPARTAPGRLTRREMLADYAAHLHHLAPLPPRRSTGPLRVVVDAGNGMAGHTAPAVLGGLDLDMVPLYYELDGTFPHHEANPIDPANLVDLRHSVISQHADVGLAFDGDADRCFAVDERGELVTPSALTALIADRELARVPGSVVIHSLITSRAVPELIAERGGTALRSRVGHSYVKAQMAQTGAVFAGEHSGHFYFRDFWRADSGMLAALHLLAAMSQTDLPLSELMADYDRYSSSGEINSSVSDPADTIKAISALYDTEDGVTLDHLDGLTVTARTWWFNVRASNTEPLLRLNVEGQDDATMTRVRDRVLHDIRSHA